MNSNGAWSKEMVARGKNTGRGRGRGITRGESDQNLLSMTRRRYGYDTEKWIVCSDKPAIKITDEDRMIEVSYLKSLGTDIKKEDLVAQKKNEDIHEMKFKGLDNSVRNEIENLIRLTIGSPYHEEEISDVCSRSSSHREALVTTNSSIESCFDQEDKDDTGFMGFARALRNCSPPVPSRGKVLMFDEDFPRLGESRNKENRETTNVPERRSALEYPKSIDNTAKYVPRESSRSGSRETNNYFVKHNVPKHHSISYDKIDYSRNAAITSLLQRGNSREDNSTDSSSKDSYVKHWLDTKNNESSDKLQPENKMETSKSGPFQNVVSESERLKRFLLDDDCDFIPCGDESPYFS